MTFDKKLVTPLLQAAYENGVSFGDGVDIAWMFATTGKIDFEGLRKDGVLSRVLGAGQKIANDPTNGPKLTALLASLKE